MLNSGAVSTPLPRAGPPRTEWRGNQALMALVRPNVLAYDPGSCATATWMHLPIIGLSQRWSPCSIAAAPRTWSRS